MKIHKPWWRLPVLAIVSIAILILLATVLRSWPAFADASRNTSELASWVQAIGSIIAIYVALWINDDDRQSRKLESERQNAQRAAAFAARMTPFIAEVRNGLEYIDNSGIDHDENFLRGLREPIRIVQLLTLPRLGDVSILSDLNSLDVATIQRCMLLISVIDNWNGYVNTTFLNPNDWPLEIRTAFRKDMRIKLGAIRESANELQIKFNGIMDDGLQAT